MLIDGPQRQQATNPQRSYIVQAPAGSGKTEILTQRFLRLLSTVAAPEQIIALTFTRKAANEMRERILNALRQASLKVTAKSAHQQQTLSFANAALTRSQSMAWNILEQPSRLKIMTIDALCQSITQAMPLQDKHIAFANISEKSNDHYLRAARQCIQYAIEQPECQSAISTLLLHLDNQQAILIDLLSALLASRDQWLHPLFQAKYQDKALYEQALAFIEHHELSRFRESLPPEISAELVDLTREVVTIEANPDSPRYPLSTWNRFDETSAKEAKALAALLLTTDQSFRKGFDHHVGLRKASCPEPDYQRIKADSKMLLSQLSDYPDCLEALLRVKDLPEPHYNPGQWAVLNALFTLLPLLVGHLQLVFAEKNEVDFTAISQQALAALGDEAHPTDLALYLDHTVHHLLVDEFQDTSITQYQLINQLVQGWLPDEGKTLFLVGDPMQSIYRFRQAEVGLFLKAQQQGIGPVHLTPLELQCNFRSTASIVNWVNQQFPDIFPTQFDIESGAVSFHPSVSVLNENGSGQIQALQFSTREQEAEALIQIVKNQLSAFPEGNIAVLVRSRHQLTDITQALRAHQIPYQGVEIDLLAQLPHIRDLETLTKALLMPANRLAWFALLRSPYGGLSLHDLHQLAQVDPKKSIYWALSQPLEIDKLSEDGRPRARFAYQVMHQALSQRHQSSLSVWIEQTHKALKGEQILSATQANDLEQFWLLIDRLNEDNQISDFNALEQELEKLYSKQVTPAQLQIMTIHKSKGLEFDCVILPGMGSSSKQRDKPLLRWLKLPTENQEDLLLLSPIKPVAEDKCELYDYLGKLDEQKNHYELQRLFYVAATRAKTSLYLLDHQLKTTKNSFRGLLKNQNFNEPQEETTATSQSLQRPSLYKLPISYYGLETYPAPALDNQVNPVLTVSTARLAGTLAHQLLQNICESHIMNYEAIPWSFVHYELNRLGLTEEDQACILEQLSQWLKQLFSCPKGQWIISQHSEERNEYELLIAKDRQLSTRIIDRTFIENDILWIIDFKTGQPDKAHHKQVNHYAHLLASRSTLAIRCGLYYLPNNHWETWEFEFA